MAGHGPSPKEATRRQRRNSTPGTVALDVGARVRRPPALPPRAGRGNRWSAATRRWYDVWKRSPQATLFTATDWQRLHMLAELVESYFLAPSKEILAEIRLNEAKLGATPEDRQRLHWELVDDGDAPSSTSTKKRSKDPRLSLIQGGA
jgi:hypothetical protein